jgi:hypothetical protein
MAKQVQFRRGTTSQHSTFTGAVGEITVDTDKDTVVVHDGSTAGGVPLAKSSELSAKVESLADLGVTASAADLNKTDVTTLGTVEASKVVTADANGDVTFPDGEKALFGTGSDLQIYHSGSQSVIADAGTGNLLIQADELLIQNTAGDANYIRCVSSDESVQLRFANSTKLATTSTGVDINGELIADSYNETYAAVTSTTNATTVNCEAGNAFSHTLTENTTFTFSNPPASGTAYSFSIEIIQDASASGYTVTWPSSVDWPAATAPTLTATASAKDVFVFYTRDGGTTWYGFTAGQALG